MSGKEESGGRVKDSVPKATHPLLDELRGVLHRLKGTAQPVKDGHRHLVSLCETLEMVFRDGLKQPNSWFGLNKQDYWSWIEPLQDYFFNERENPLLRQVVATVAVSKRLRSLQARGRCFIRVALCQKIISVPIEHLVKNERLTQYWYSQKSIIGDHALREALMSILFEITELNFSLDIPNSSFLDETWIIPVYMTLKLPPVKTLDIKIGYTDGRGIIVEIEDGCLADKVLNWAGAEVGDLLDLVCGEPVVETSHRKLRDILVAKSVDSTELVIVKKHLPDGSPFSPILRRQLLLDVRASGGDLPYPPGQLPFLERRRPSLVVQTHAECTEYSVVYLGANENVSEETTDEAIDQVISQVLNTEKKSQEVVVRVGQSNVDLLTLPAKEPMAEFLYHYLYGCGRGVRHQTCMVLMAHSVASARIAHVLEAPSMELAQSICAHIAQGFNRGIKLRTKSW